MSTCTYCQSSFYGQSLFCCQSCKLLSNWLEGGVAPLNKLNSVSAKWLKYNQLVLESTFNSSIGITEKKFKFYIGGLQCSSCVHLLEDFSNYFPDVIYSKLNYSSRTLETTSKISSSLGTICEAIEQLGYEPTPIKESADYEMARTHENRDDLKRLGVAAAIAGNLMLFSIPVYVGLEGPLAFIFNWISFFIFLPLLFYVAVPFYKKSWGSLLVRRINVDTMIVVALWTGFALSTYNLLQNFGQIYFDSTASFIFLIVATRYWLKRQQDKLIHKNIFSDLFTNEIYEVKSEVRLPAHTLFLSLYQIKKEHLLVIKQNQLIPCDGELISKTAEFDLSFLTGEAFPQVKLRGEKVRAGSRLVSALCDFHCKTEAIDSELSQALAKLEIEHESKSEIQTLSDLISHRLTLVVFSLAAVFFAFTYRYLGIEAFQRCLALITIACPCAVAFGTPLAHSLGLKKALRKGYFIKSSAVFEKLSHIKKIIFDKTGTLTLPQLSLVEIFPPNLCNEYKSVILGLENASLHPVALTLKALWKEMPTASIEKVTEVAGQGVEANYSGHLYQLSKAYSDEAHEIMQVDFFVDQLKVASLSFEEKVKPEAALVISKFNQLYFKTMMLTGDIRHRALAVAKSVGIKFENVYFEQSLISKQMLVKKENPCLFVGDGLNDVAALSEAYVSFAIQGAFESTLQVSDIYAPKKNLSSLLEIIDWSHKIHQTVKTNLAFALFYNLAGGACALLGFINPLVAAVLMPISSALIIAHTTWRLR
ncbi:MAG: cation-translocating P-type ATPase [Bdellovibrionaceae bacterium]|nr:cation-translocating P-type ATPase [Bdellovibrio sp.]